MSKQQDELQEQIHILLIDYDHAGMWQSSASKEIMKLVNSEIQAVLEHLSGRLIEEGETTLPQVDVYEAIKEVRKDYE